MDKTNLTPAQVAKARRLIEQAHQLNAALRDLGERRIEAKKVFGHHQARTSESEARNLKTMQVVALEDGERVLTTAFERQWPERLRELERAREEFEFLDQQYKELQARWQDAARVASQLRDLLGIGGHSVQSIG